jgi:hypothetical protein
MTAETFVLHFQEGTRVTCRYCAAWAEMADYCGTTGPHDERTQAIAIQLAGLIYPEGPTDQQTAYFMEDACEVAAVVSGNVVIKAMRPTRFDQHRFSASGHIFAAAEEGGGLIYRGRVKGATDDR